MPTWLEKRHTHSGPAIRPATKTQTMSKRNRNRRPMVDIVNPSPAGSRARVSCEHADALCRSGKAYRLDDSRIKLRHSIAPAAGRQPSDVYIKGPINWRGSASLDSYHRPGEVRC